jgi:hypothetical protein
MNDPGVPVGRDAGSIDLGLIVVPDKYKLVVLGGFNQLQFRSLLYLRQSA